LDGINIHRRYRCFTVYNAGHLIGCQVFLHTNVHGTGGRPDVFRVPAVTDKENTASHRVMEKSGMKYEKDVEISPRVWFMIGIVFYLTIWHCKQAGFKKFNFIKQEGNHHGRVFRMCSNQGMQ